MSAIFKDGNGFWRDVAKEKEEEAARVAATPGYYDELLPKTPGQGKFGIASGPNQNVGLEEVLKTKKIERADIDTFKGLLQPAMAGGVDAQAELVGILSDPTASDTCFYSWVEYLSRSRSRFLRLVRVTKDSN